MNWELLLSRCMEVVTGGPGASTGETLLRGALIGCSLFASLQLMTMLMTRWGDHHAMAKSFVLSILVHLCLGLGWATVVDPRPIPPPPSGPEERIPIREVVQESSEDLSQPNSGDLPVWQKPLDIPAPEVARTEREATQLPTPELQRTETEIPDQPPLLDLTAISTAVESPAPLPEPQTAPDVPAAPTPVATTAAPETVTEARPESTTSAAMTRQSIARAPQPEPVPFSTPQPGGAQRTAPEPDDMAFAIPLPTDEQPTLPKAVGSESDTIARKASPTAMPLDAPTAGATAANLPASPGSAASDGPRFTRSNRIGPTGTSDSDTPSRPEPFRPNVDPNRERLMASRKPVGSATDLDPQPDVNPSRPAAAAIGTRPQSAATTYRLRRIEKRQDIALKNGGTRQSEQAVEAALAFLARAQHRDGYWDADQYGGGIKDTRPIEAGKPTGGTETDSGLTGLAVLAFLGAGYTHEEGEYADNVSRAVRWLIDQQREDGYLGGKATYYDQMYCHGIATYALAEAYGMQNDPTHFTELRDAVSRGAWYIAQTQNTDGGWRYRVGASLSDMSMFGWQLMALKSAELAGIATPAKTRSGMIQFLRDRGRGQSGGLAGYKADEEPTPAMTAEALFCKQMYGLRRSSLASQEAVEHLQRNLPTLTKPNEYYWYYGTLAMFQHGGPQWDAWNAATRDTLLRLQRQGGANGGSWDPVGPWGSVGGRIYSTAVSTMCLEVYYRFLPLYQVGGAE
ncbi:MAG TPA: hypothetical protein VM165_05430 [Planctomycetaceae bacterium]|nr:hypothetical protein [Planctomycetaceae bacterium]